MKLSIEIPAPVRTVLNLLWTSNATCFLVGGAVRDLILDKPMKDWDIEVFGLDLPVILDILKDANIQASAVGIDFGIIKANVQGFELDLAVPRTEIKTGDGHGGFEIKTNPQLDTVIASARRDFTINSMMLNLANGEVLDHHGGFEDCINGVLRHTSPAFSEDALRVLRAFQFISRFGFTVAPETLQLCQSLINELAKISKSRFTAELRKFAKGNHHQQALQLAKQTGIAGLLGIADCNIENIELSELPISPNHTDDERLAIILSVVLFINGKTQIPTPLANCMSVQVQKACSQLLNGLHAISFTKSAMVNANWLLHLAPNWGRTQLQELLAFVFGNESLSMQNAMQNADAKPIINAKNMPTLKGKELGDALKKLHFAQLDGKFQTIEQGLALLPSL